MNDLVLFEIGLVLFAIMTVWAIAPIRDWTIDHAPNAVESPLASLIMTHVEYAGKAVWV